MSDPVLEIDVAGWVEHVKHDPVAYLKKSRSRHIEPDRDSLDDPEIKRRSGAQWDTLKLELSNVPDFEMCFTRVRDFYRGLPWGGDIGGAAPASKAVANAASDQPAVSA